MTKPPPVHFANAPVSEMLQAVYFSPVSGWDLLNFGLLSPRLAQRYPRHQFQPPIGDPAQLQNQFLLQVQKMDIGKIPIRCWFIENSEAELLQLQDSCLIHNWRKIPASVQYPGFDRVRSNFAADWKTFCAFLDDVQLGRPDVWKCELTYIDQFVRGVEWKTFADLPRIYRLWRGIEAAESLSEIEFASFSVNYVLPDQTTRLLFTSQPAIRQTDGKEVIQLTITASGKPQKSDEKDVIDWFDRAHASLIEGFLSFTTHEVQDLWRRTQ